MYKNDTNKYKVWMTIIVLIVVVFIVINSKMKNNKQSNLDNILENAEKVENIKHTDNESNENNINQTKNNEIDFNQNVIERFIEYCNNNEIKKAYNLLSQDCKNELFPSVDDFYDKYYKKKFSTKKNYTIMLWKNMTYMINLKECSIETGVLSSEVIRDYITYTRNGLNIGGYIGREKANRTINVENIKIDILYRNTYIDYEEYAFSIKNNSKASMILDSKEKANTLYIKDQKGLKYYAYMYELNKSELIYDQNEERKIIIKYEKMYDTNIYTKNIIFDDVTIGEEKTQIMIALGE